MRTSPLSNNLSPEEMDALLGGSGYGPKDESTAPIPDEAIAAADPLPVTTPGSEPEPPPAPDEPGETAEEPEAPEEKQAEAAPVPPAASVPQAAEQPAPAAPTQTTQSPWYKPLVSTELASAENGESKLVSKAPNWYDFAAPPEITGNAQALASLVSGLIQAGVARNKKTAIAMALGGAADAVNAKLAAPQQDYQNKLKSAQGQASMAATLGHGQGQALQLAMYDLQERKFRNQLDKEEAARRLAAARDQLDSPETKQIQDTFIKNGVMDEKTARTMTGNQILMGRVGAQQQAGAERQLGNQVKMNGIRYDQWAEKNQITEGQHDKHFAQTEGAKQDSEERERQRKLSEAALPGMSFESGYAPDAASVHEARKTNIARIGATRAAYELAKLQDQVSLVAQGGGDLYTVFGSDEQQKQILARMRALQNRLAANLREIYHQGVPQQFEIALNETVNPRADSIMTFFRGPSSWRALGDEANKAGLEELYYGYGAFENGEGVHNPELTKPPMKKDSHQRVQEAGQALDTPSEVVPKAVELGKKAAGAAGRTVAAVANGAGPAAQTIKIQVMDPATKAWGAAKDVTREQYRVMMHTLAQKKLPPNMIRKAQE